MNILFLFLMLALNFGISWYNARSVGKSWADSQVIGGWQRFLVLCGWVMSACGFTWVYLTIISMLAGSLGYLPMEYVRLSMEIGYVVIIFPILGSGIAIWMNSVTTAYREGGMGNYAVAGWNTFAQVHNTYSAVTTLPGVFSHIGSVFSGSEEDDARNRFSMLAIFIVIFAIIGGFMTTHMIVRSTAREYAQSVVCA